MKYISVYADKLKRGRMDLIYPLSSAAPDTRTSKMVWTVYEDGLDKATVAFEQSSPYAVSVDWGDGSIQETTSSSPAILSHTYASAGDYTVKFTCAEGETWSAGATVEDSVYTLAGLYQITANDTTVKSISFGAGVTSIGTLSGEHFTDTLTTVSISADITEIPALAFRGDSLLAKVSLPQTITSFGYQAFYGCSNMVLNALPPLLQTIGIQAFARCFGLGNVVIPYGVTELARAIFNTCTSLYSVVMEGQITSIGSAAFAACTALSSITCKATVPPTVANANAFSNVKADCAIYVPAESVSAYQAADIWSTRAAYIQAIPT